VKYLFSLFFAAVLIFAQEPIANNAIKLAANSSSSDEPIVIEDNSGLSDDEVRNIAKESDKSEKEDAKNKELVESIDEDGKIDLGKINLEKLKSKWEELSPEPKSHDWIQTKSGEWFKGEIKAMYNDKLEFDSDEVGLYTFDFEDVTQIKSFNIISVNIDEVASFEGIVRFKENEITIIQGNNKYTFKREEIVAFAKGGDREVNYWSGKVTLSIDARSGNKEEFNYTAQANVKRRTEKTSLTLDYLGRISSSNDVETSNDHRINQKYDRFITRRFFWTPIFSEIFIDKYQNIDRQLSGGIGIGYTIVDTKSIEWSISGGPAILNTKYITVEDGQDTSVTSIALEIGTLLEYEINSRTDLKYDYKLTYTDDSSGKYKHHMVLTLENEITSWLDIDFTGVWDTVLKPETREDGTVPGKNDYQLLVGLGIEF
jgi:Protein of unknown function, DUF481